MNLPIKPSDIWFNTWEWAILLSSANLDNIRFQKDAVIANAEYVMALALEKGYARRPN